MENLTNKFSRADVRYQSFRSSTRRQTDNVRPCYGTLPRKPLINSGSNREVINQCYGTLPRQQPINNNNNNNSGRQQGKIKSYPKIPPEWMNSAVQTGQEEGEGHMKSSPQKLEKNSNLGKALPPLPARQKRENPEGFNPQTLKDKLMARSRSPLVASVRTPQKENLECRKVYGTWGPSTFRCYGEIGSKSLPRYTDESYDADCDEEDIYASIDELNVSSDSASQVYSEIAETVKESDSMNLVGSRQSWPYSPRVPGDRCQACGFAVGEDRVSVQRFIYHTMCFKCME
ncbi:uncharacterized protein LOC106163056 [Lingula anatina]|uniref:Uncharacterized protein LOC106163056 n=1 Tax=Lingula anatina TaxID=7574 RepID=A0A1S3IEU1_LINAN|nr:uncharacterized protein LOC106163056 [Lingula anatina]|eukprot:XP_013395979.1 uncharacterized protein LOC106163056 [Lingula anatina]